MNPQIRAILWAQFLSIAHAYSRSKTGHAFGIIIMGLWYGIWGLIAWLVSRVFADPEIPSLLPNFVPGGLLLVMLYWQVVPVLIASTGSSLEIKKLLVYPIPHAQLFGLEVLLRVSGAFEMLILLIGVAVGVALNPHLPLWSSLGVIPFIVFNLCLSAGIREVLMRIFARKRIREVAVLLLVSLGALPQALILTVGEARLKQVLGGVQGVFWPWSATGSLLAGMAPLLSLVVMLVWVGGAYSFGRWQFERGLRFDAEAAQASSSGAGSKTRAGIAERFFRWPTAVFRDPLAALVEKEIRFLARAPRFRLVFTMGFTFGLVIWLPMVMRHKNPGFFQNNYLTLVSLYALLLLGDVCFFNSFGFDRSATQVYYVMPGKFRTVLLAKNITAIFFVFLEITLVIAVCALVRAPISGAKLIEAYLVTLVVSAYLMAVGNLTSTYSPRPVNPQRSMAHSAAGRMQALLVLVYPIAALPVLLSYAARWAMQSEIAFYAGLVVAAFIGVVVYGVAMDSSVGSAESRKEQIVGALSAGQGPIE